MPLVKRLIKGSTLTYQEMDDNLSFLDNKVSGSNGYITRFSGSNALTSSLLNQIASTVFVYGSFNVSQSLTVGGISIIPNSPLSYIATGSVTASVDINDSTIFSITSASVNFAKIDKTIGATSFGSSALNVSSYGISNTAIGDGTLSSNTSGNGNTAIGKSALNSNTTGISNTAMGNGAAYYNSTGSFNTAIGYEALTTNRTGTNLTAIGYQAAYSNYDGVFNTALGYQAGYYTSNGSYNTSTGFRALFFNTSGTDNAAFGLRALYNNTTGIQNTGIGVDAGRTNSTGSANVFVGFNAGYNESGSNKLYIANNSGSTPLIKGDFSTGLLQFNTSAGTQITGSFSVNTSNKSLFTVSPSSRYLSFTDFDDLFGNNFFVYLSGSNSNNEILIQTGNKGLSVDNRLKVVSTGTQITGSLIVSGSGATFYNIITLPALSTLPTGAASGSIATSGSNGELKPYFYNGSTWTSLF
jgi:hypothetical protein